MKISEMSEVLTKIAAYDRRTLGAADVMVWHEVVGDIDRADAMEAVRRWYSEHTEWMMPAHLRRLVRDIVREREAAARATGWAPGQAGVPREDAMPEVATGGRMALSDLPAAVADLVARVRADLPEGSREALMPRRVAWERERAAYQRTQDAESNPRYRPCTDPDNCFNMNHAHNFQVAQPEAFFDYPDPEVSAGGRRFNLDEMWTDEPTAGKFWWDGRWAMRREARGRS